MRNLIAVGLGGFVGAAGRYLLGGLIQSWTGSASFAWGTFGANVVMEDVLIAGGGKQGEITDN